MSSTVVATRVSSTVAAVEGNLWSMWSQFGHGPGCALRTEGGVLWFETPIFVPPYNMVVRCHAETGEDVAITNVVSRFQRRAVPLVWFVHPSARPTNLESRLRRHGLDAVEEVAGMAMALADVPAPPLVPQGVEIHEVTPAHDLAPYLEFVAARWQVPAAARRHLTLIADAFRIGVPGSPNRAWVAVKNGMAIAKIFTHDVDDVIGVYGMATRPTSRGLGLGRALCLTALADARARGCTLAVLHSTPMAVPLYRSVGFRDVAPFTLFAEPGSFYA